MDLININKWESLKQDGIEQLSKVFDSNNRHLFEDFASDEVVAWQFLGI
jgi:hypothetical protein